jgi:TetR/AcrR family transcriptional repressor of lmrAB and yxaGH operons
MPELKDPPSTRDRMIEAMLLALRTKGFHGVGLNEILEQARAPKGVLYHHFPGGKSELAVAAIEQVIDHITRTLDKVLERNSDPAQALIGWMGSAQKQLSLSGFESGCPLATVALESTPEDIAIRAALAKGFQAIRHSLTTAFIRAGMEAPLSNSLAALIVSAYEGALVQARVAGSVKVMQETTQALVLLLSSQMPSAKK